MTTPVTELFEAIRSGDLAKVESLVSADSTLVSARNESGVSAVLASVYFGKKEIRDLLLAKGPQLELQDAAAVGRLDRVQQLVEANPDAANSFSPDGFPVVALAAFFGQFEATKYLAEKGANIHSGATNGSGYNALTGAVTAGHTEIVKWLLEAGADPNYVYGPGYTPLLAAAANGRLGIVKLLLQHGADTAHRANDGNSAADLATERQHQPVADFLKNR
jgi:ankyrin repeat protein